MDYLINEFAIEAIPFVGFFVLCLILVVGARRLRHEAAAALQLRRTIGEAPSTLIRAASEGVVKLCGRACPQLSLAEGALTGRPCVWYRYHIEQNVNDGEGFWQWKTIERGNASQPFLLADDSGRCIVDPAGADLRLRTVSEWRGRQRNPRNHTLNKWYQFSRPYRFTEERIEDDETLFCVGRLTPLGGLARLAVSDDKHQPFLISTYADAERKLTDELTSKAWRSASGYVVVGTMALILATIFFFVQLAAYSLSG